MEGIGARIKQIIEDLNLTPIAFSEKIGIQRSSLSHLFSGRNKPSIDLLLKLKKHYPAIDLEWLITGESQKDLLADHEHHSKSIEKEEENDVTFVNNDIVTPDNQLNTTNKENASFESRSKEEIDRIVIFYKNGSFKNYDPTQ